MNRIGIIGTGKLATSFVSYFHHQADLWGTSRNKEKLPIDLQEKIELFNFQLGGGMNHLPITDSSDLIYMIPPSKMDDYVEKSIEFFRTVLEINPSIRIIFISSTSVYGSKARKVDEESKVEPKSENAKKLVEVESFLLDYNAWILRCGGLVSNSRHPVYFLIDRNSIPKPKAVVNLIHEHDVSRFMKRLVKNDKDFGVYNLVCPQHPEREEYYSEVANRLGLNPPNFNETDQRKGKIVLPKKLLNSNFSFDFSSPFEMPLVRK